MTGAETSSFSLSGFQTCTSPNRPGAPPTAASFFPSGENAMRLHALRDADQPRLERELLGVVEQHFVIAGDGERLAVGREGERSDDRRGRVLRRVRGIDRDGLRAGGRVVLRALLDPVRDQLHLNRVERVAALRHLGLAVFVSVICATR